MLELDQLAEPARAEIERLVAVCNEIRKDMPHAARVTGRGKRVDDSKLKTSLEKAEEAVGHAILDALGVPPGDDFHGRLMLAGSEQFEDFEAINNHVLHGGKPQGQIFKFQPL